MPFFSIINFAVVMSSFFFQQAMGLDHFQLCGHSLGGYVAGAYALKHPHRLHGLVLASPAGVPEPDREALAKRREEMMNGASWRRRFFFNLAEKVRINRHGECEQK